jgi:hypothetical protein
MKLEYELIEDAYDDTTHIRTMTEQARVQGKGWLIRTTLYTPHHITANVVFVPTTGGAGDAFFDPISP